MPLRSQTWRDLRRLLKELPPNRLRFLVVVLVASFLQGLMDILLVGLLARLVGLMAGVKLADALRNENAVASEQEDNKQYQQALLH